MLRTVILIDVEHTNDRNDIARVDHFQSLFGIGVFCDLILLKGNSIKEGKSLEAFLDGIELLSQFCHRLCIDCDRSITSFSQIGNHCFDASHYFKLNILFQDFILVLKKDLVGMSAINVAMAAFILEINGYFLQAVIITHSLCGENDASVLQVELAVITQQRLCDCICHSRVEFLIAGVCGHGNTLGDIAGLGIENVLSRSFVAKRIIKLPKIVVAYLNYLSNHNYLFLKTRLRIMCTNAFAYRNIRITKYRYFVKGVKLKSLEGRR